MRSSARVLATLGTAVVLALVLSCAGAADDGRGAPAPAGITRAQADEIVRAHNTWRRRAGVLSLRWAADLAAPAQRRAQYLASHGCVIEHGLLPDDEGENLYRAGPIRASGRQDELLIVSATQVVDAWGAESADYSPASDSCAPNRQCGHYTQIVWPSTEEVGCGMSVCPTLGQVWVCRYRPKGNIRMLR